MNLNFKQTVIAVLIAAALTSTAAFAADNEDADATINHQHAVNDVRVHSNTVVNNIANTRTNDSRTTDLKLSLDAAAKLRLDAAAKLRYDGSRTDRVKNVDVDKNVNVDKNVDVREEKNSHSVDVSMSKKLSLSSDIAFSGDPEITGTIDTDSAAIAVIDNRQSISGNAASNDKLSNTSSIDDDVAASAAGNIGVNIAGGDNNAQDNAAALSATDASFAFGMADAEVFVNQNGSGNATLNSGVTNAASISDNAFRNAAGNIGVNVASGNNNAQKNALSASVATTAYAQSSISSNQVSSGNLNGNAGLVQRFDDTTEVSMGGTVRGLSLGVGVGGYAGRSTGSFDGTSSSTLDGTADQIGNVYPDIWSNNANDDPTDAHPSAGFIAHVDLDADTQGGSDLNQDGGALAFGVDGTSSGTVGGSTQSRERGRLGFVELSASDLYADLTGSVVTSRYVIRNATNDASLSNNAFRNASGNIGVNVASGSGNLQANSLALSVAQPSTGGAVEP